MKFKSVVLTKRGGPDVLQIQENSLKEPREDELQIKIIACGVGSTDAAMRYGFYPYAPKIPFVPGYEIVGVVTKIGSAISRFNAGDKVATLTVHGGYSEYIVLKEEDLVAVPIDIPNDQAVACILNYSTAYQILHRVLKVSKGGKLLILGASGGVGSALVDLGKNLGLTMYGTASPRKHSWLSKNGAMPLDYKSEKLVDQLRSLEPLGMDYVVDGVGGSNIEIGFKILNKGGKLVEYAYPNFFGMLKGLWELKLINILPNGKTGEFYGITASYNKDRSQILDDLSTLFEFVSQGKINPLIDRHFPLIEAKEANQYLESGQAFGKIVLVNRELG